MSSNNDMNWTGYTSCMKLFGVPILPPLITDERRKEINDDKQRAIEIEKKLKGKRSSIDSGVMTGSYIDQFKTNEFQQFCESQLSQFPTDDFNLKRGFENGVQMLSSEVVNCAVSDSFLKTALEDPEFRDFFSSTAEKIFKDNKIENILDLSGGGDLQYFQLNNVCSKESELQSSEVFSESNYERDSEFFHLNFSDSLGRVPSVAESIITLKDSENMIISGGESDCKQVEDPPSPQPTRIRRNSYTLESPSPVLLEHLAKEIVSGKGEAHRWHTPPDKKEKNKGPGFKTFSGRSQRKHWNKNICNQSSILGVENYRTKYTLKKSNTFVKPETKIGESNYSLPAGSHKNPLQYCSFTRSVDCLNSLGVNPLFDSYKKEKGDAIVSPTSVNKVNIFQINTNLTSDAASDSETLSDQKVYELQSASSETSPISLTNNPSCSVKSYCGTENCSPPQIEFNDSASQVSASTQSTYVQQSLVYAPSLANGNITNDVSHPYLDDLGSLCSSMSISRFFPTNDISRPSTADDMSENSIHPLKKKHQSELRELLEKQRKEEEMYSKLLSTSGSLASRTTTNLSNGEPSETNPEVIDVDKKESCIRELFPSQEPFTGKAHTKPTLVHSEKEKDAAIKLTACAKGYLTRRLLKTEKVQQLVELIKESLTCAFSLQKEPCLKPNDLELHARLAHQLNAALCELQDIASAPVSVRMAIIAADRERLRRPASRPSSTISSATRKSILRRQQSLNSAEEKPLERRARRKSSSDNGNTGSASYGSRVRSGSVSASSVSTISTSSSRQPWR